MDSPLLWKPWQYDSRWIPITEGLHLDQNPFSKPDKVCIQGMVPLFPVTAAVGGLAVVPQSHTGEKSANTKELHSHWRNTGDFCVLSRKSVLQKESILVLADAGDLILWDSRTVHGGLVGTGQAKSDTVELARLSQTVCMLPRKTASEATLEGRKNGFAMGAGFSHWANELHVSGGGRAGYQPIELTEEQRALL
jgi:hypothetical protein